MNEFDKLKLIIAEEMDIEADTITEEQSLREDLEMDQISVLQVMMAMEVEFGIELDPTDIEQIKTVGDCLSFITDSYTY